MFISSDRLELAKTFTVSWDMDYRNNLGNLLRKHFVGHTNFTKSYRTQIVKCYLLFIHFFTGAKYDGIIFVENLISLIFY